jgi:apolipoprotein N-acyltransferase
MKVFSRNLSGAGKVRPDLLILITNDGWFGAGQGPAQHFAQARARAIELGLPMLRVANRGVTAVIDPWGRSRERLDLHQRGALDAPIPKPRAATFYAKKSLAWRVGSYRTLGSGGVNPCTGEIIIDASWRDF